jgi:hypothetical protein
MSEPKSSTPSEEWNSPKEEENTPEEEDTPLTPEEIAERDKMPTELTEIFGGGYSGPGLEPGTWINADFLLDPPEPEPKPE